MSAACVHRCCCLLWLFCVDGNCVSIRVTEGEESPKRSIGRREEDGDAFLHQLRVECIGIRCGDPKRHAPSQFARCIEVNHRCPDRKRDRFGIEDNRAGWIARGCSETDLLYVEGFGGLKVAYLERNKAWTDQFWRSLVLARCCHDPYNIYKEPYMSSVEETSTNMATEHPMADRLGYVLKRAQ